jgi:acyl-coenzyme A thioesterase PaaI-like protein
VPRVVAVTVGETLLRGEVAALDDGAALALDRRLSGLPDMAHGGSVLALFDAVAGHAGARRIRGHYIRRVPLATDLTLRRSTSDAGSRLALVDAGGTTLVDGIVAAAAEPHDAAAPAPGAAAPLPVSASCFVCGRDNAIGLRAALGFDELHVTGRWEPRAPYRTRAGTLAPVALTALLDETAFWLGALATGESGMTTEIDVTLLRPVPFGAAVTVAGDRRRVTPRAADPRYLDTESMAWGEDGAPAAIGRITFVIVRGATRRMVSWLAATSPPDVIDRVFRR